MPANKNALLRYRTIDKCLQNRGRKWTLNDLIDACSDALYELEGKETIVSKRTVQLDLQLLRSDKLGYNAPIEVYDRRYYRYADPEYSITDVPLTESDLDVIAESVAVLRQFKDFSLFSELSGVIQKLEDKIHRAEGAATPIIHLDKNEQLRGLEHLDTVYQAIGKRIVLWITYHSFRARRENRFRFHAAFLREYNNRWFVVGRKEETDLLMTLALDRIEKLEADLRTDYLLPDIDPATYYADTIGVTVFPERKPMSVLLWIDRQNAPYVLTKPLHPSQRQLERRKDGSIEVEITVVHNFELERLLLGFGEHLTVLAPLSFRRRMREISKAMVANYQRN